jgi:hypothetical protein
MKFIERLAPAAVWFALIGGAAIAAWAMLALSDLIGTQDVTESAGQPEAAVVASASAQNPSRQSLSDDEQFQVLSEMAAFRKDFEERSGGRFSKAQIDKAVETYAQERFREMLKK